MIQRVLPDWWAAHRRGSIFGSLRSGEGAGGRVVVPSPIVLESSELLEAYDTWSEVTKCFNLTNLEVDNF